MFRLFKLLLVIIGAAAFVWFGANVPLGARTLFQHLQAIGRTPETQELLDGTREKARPLMDDVRRRLAGSDDEGDPRPSTVTGAVDAGSPPAEKLTAEDRQRLRKLLGSAGQRTGRSSM